jgi:hypothetical protein
MYLPAVEALESLRLFSGTAPSLPNPAAPLDVHVSKPVTDSIDPHPDTWDEALLRSRVAELLGTAVETNSASILAGLAQMEKYLARAWHRGGLDPQLHEDCTQAVFLSLLQHYGRDGFEQIMGEVGDRGIREVFSRDTVEGPDFFRAVDAVKKRAQRLRPRVSLEDAGEVSAPVAENQFYYREALEQAIARHLNDREADLVWATLRGETPMEIAEHWGLTPKTVSNEKCRVFQKLRACSLLAELYD